LNTGKKKLWGMIVVLGKENYGIIILRDRVKDMIFYKNEKNYEKSQAKEDKSSSIKKMIFISKNHNADS
jgi:signal recognition particle receptor subunit beta